jgi:hypothetical protein
MYLYGQPYNCKIRQTRQIRVTLAKLNFCKSGKSSQNGSANVGKSGESSVNSLVNVGESGESSVNGLANFGKSGESGTIPKKTILASTQICQKWQISGEYSNLLNLLASGLCLILTPTQNILQ